MPFITSKIALFCEDQNRAGFQDSGFKSSDGKESSAFNRKGLVLSMAYALIRVVLALCVFSIGRVVISASVLS